MLCNEINVIPIPKEVYNNGVEFGTLRISPKIYYDNPESEIYATTFAQYANRIHGINFERGQGGIELCSEELANGEYHIECNSNTVKLYYGDKDGLTNALATLLQLISVNDNEVIVPNVKIIDKPDCEYRSLMVDIAREWHDFETIFEYIDLCYLYKVKYLHLHFVDNESYTLPSERFPKLPTHGRHYTKKQISEINEYAHARNIELIPEIEAPGHAAAMVSAYPELFANTLDGSDMAEAETTEFRTGFKNNIVCVGKKDIMKTLKDLVAEVIEMFPYSRYLHIGGDEARINEWDSCIDCKEYMKEHNINSVKELYTHFIKLMTDMVLDMGKIPVVWEGFPKEGNETISRDVLVIAWESYYHLSTDFIDEGFNIVNASWEPMYITPGKRWKPENILKWNIYTWKHWWEKSAAYLQPIYLQPTNQVKGGILCAWECTYEQEIESVRENLAAFSERTWNITGTEDVECFKDKLNCISQLAIKLSSKS